MMREMQHCLVWHDGLNDVYDAAARPLQWLAPV